MISSDEAYVIANQYAIMQDPDTVSVENNNLYVDTTHNTEQIYINDKLLNERYCLTVAKKSSIITKKARGLFNKILKAFIKSKFDFIPDTFSKCTLPAINSPIDNYFFKKCSKSLQKLISDPTFNLEKKLAILKELSFLLDKTPALSDTQSLIVASIVSSASNCLMLCSELNSNAIWQETVNTNGFINTFIYNKKVAGSLNENINASKQLIQYPLSIDLLFIEEEARFLTSSKCNKSIDLGAHVLNNEWDYMERCYRGFLFLLNIQIESICDISFTDLRKVNAILGGHISFNITSDSHVYYGCKVPRGYGYQFIQLVKQGLISDSNFKDSDTNLSDEDRMLKLQHFLQSSLGINIQLSKIIIDSELYFVINADHMKSKTTLEDSEQQLLDDLHGKTQNKAFIFNINKTDSEKDKCLFSIQIEYCYKKNRAEVCQQLLNIFYKKIKDFPEDTKKKVTLAVGLCSLLQRIHPFCDGNGRTLFFILLPILLYQMNIWLTRMFRNPWRDIDLASAEEITEKILPLCIPSPIFKKNIIWNDHIDINELMRISCSIGDLAQVEDILSIKPQLIQDLVFINPGKKPLSLLELSVLHQQPELLYFLFIHLPEDALTFAALDQLVELSLEYDVGKIYDILCLYIKNKFNLVRVCNSTK